MAKKNDHTGRVMGVTSKQIVPVMDELLNDFNKVMRNGGEIVVGSYDILSPKEFLEYTAIHALSYADAGSLKDSPQHIGLISDVVGALNGCTTDDMKTAGGSIVHKSLIENEERQVVRADMFVSNFTTEKTEDDKLKITVRRPSFRPMNCDLGSGF